ncbi:Histidine protein kinase NIK1 [Tolypocladium ophioglossoides CBS 100239]|uniref:Histidine protein kinase NIK1 n=1 Tax=Tolypocladium ophioglossoides (strain CBS 100239) TaxID=1163406 RepID=A0A0L0N4R1_TOLOC|nr:Histidine protein kinase NIK1 [Tolypocladium ophioglossoides CBS 100239]
MPSCSSRSNYNRAPPGCLTKTSYDPQEGGIEAPASQRGLPEGTSKDWRNGDLSSTPLNPSRQGEREIVRTYLKVDSSVPDHVIGDSSRFGQIILNLIGNAIKFTEHGQVGLTINEQADQAPVGPDEYACGIYTGIGIAEDKSNPIFDTFQQAGGSITRKFGGTGLGLSISKRLVNLMRGELWEHSEAIRDITTSLTSTSKQQIAVLCTVY